MDIRGWYIDLGRKIETRNFIVDTKRSRRINNSQLSRAVQNEEPENIPL